jgi:hypothetical protein
VRLFDIILNINKKEIMKNKLRDLYITFESECDLTKTERYFIDNGLPIYEIDIEQKQIIFPVEYDTLADLIDKLEMELGELNIYDYHLESY